MKWRPALKGRCWHLGRFDFGSSDKNIWAWTLYLWQKLRLRSQETRFINASVCSHACMAGWEPSTFHIPGSFIAGIGEGWMPVVHACPLCFALLAVTCWAWFTVCHGVSWMQSQWVFCEFGWSVLESSFPSSLIGYHLWACPVSKCLYIAWYIECTHLLWHLSRKFLIF
jgi:hypothetical protein